MFNYAFSMIAALLLWSLNGWGVMAQDNNIYDYLMQEYDEAVATVETVLEIELMVGAESQELETRVAKPAMFVNDTGLMLVSHRAFSEEVMDDVFGGQVQTSLSIIDVDVVLHDGQEHEAFLVATDTDLALAFLQLQNPEEARFDYVDMETGVDAGHGEPLYTLTRMEADFDYAMHVRDVMVEGKVDHPREAWVARAYHGLLGLPFFNEDGQVVGVLGSFDEVEDEVIGNPQLQPLIGELDVLFGEDNPERNFIIPIDELTGLINSAETQAEQMMQ